MSKLAKIFWLLAVLMLPGLAMAKADLRLHGSNTVGAELAPKLVKAWMQSKGYNKLEEQAVNANERTIIGHKANGDSLTVELQTYGSSTSFKDMESGNADIGMSSRPIQASEVPVLVVPNCKS